MALVNELKKTTKERQSVHTEVECLYSIFTGEDGDTYIQLDTYGSKERKIPGKVSQAIQLSERSARELKVIIERTYPQLR